MAEVNRETVRDAFAALLDTQLVDTDEIVQVVYAYQKGDITGQSPVVVVSSAGSEREQLTFDTTVKTIVYLTIHVFVLYAATGWTEANAEDRLDAIETSIADVVAANCGKTATWDALDYAGRTNRDSVVIGGDDYIREIIPIEVLVYG